ncbi:MAG: hypothetical protein J5J06_00735 [Phycisphaerae bacterium]|nr:hypothetical protein [Phycisphaerae bacterium]
MRKLTGLTALSAFLMAFGLIAAGCVTVVAPGGNSNDNANDNMSGDDLMNEEVTVGTAFELATRIGTTTGQQEGEVCGGWYPTEANHVLFVNASLGMTIRVTSDSEAHLWILCGQSNFCGDQVGTNTWSLSRFWTRGSCEIRIGTTEEGVTLDYTLELTPN